MSDPIDRPLFLIGTGRCGSSLLLRFLGYHPQLAWLSHYSARLPGDGAWGALARVHDLPGLTDLLPHAQGRRWIPQPTENYAPFNAATDGLFTAPRPLSADEVTDTARERLHALVAHHTRAMGRPRFVHKHTGFPRVAYLDAVFPDALFIHVRRDGRAVASSLCQVDWWSGEGAWGWGPLSDADLRAYHDSGRHELVLAALYWKVLMRQLDAVRDELPPSRLIEVRYDELIADPAHELRRITDFAGLAFPDAFARRIAATPITSDDTRWRRRLLPEEVALLEDVLEEDLVDHGFAP